jgi:hypothetical protein
VKLLSVLVFLFKVDDAFKFPSGFWASQFVDGVVTHIGTARALVNVGCQFLQFNGGKVTPVPERSFRSLVCGARVQATPFPRELGGL